MASVYENAFITIAATSARSGKDGFLTERPVRSSRIHGFRSDSGNDVYVREKLQHGLFAFAASATTDFSSTPLLKRGWCYQERILSTRVLHFTNCEIVWECKRTTNCECGEIEDMAMGKCTYSLRLANYQPRQDMDGETFDILKGLWRETVNAYSRMGLTNSSDVFPALSGIASKFQSLQLGKYAAGMWERDLQAGLSWKTVKRMGNVRRGASLGEYRAPTWSWASVIGPTQSSRGTGLTASPIQLLELECTPKGENVLGEICYGYIRVSGLVLPVTLYTAGPGRPDVKLVVKRARGKNWEFKFDFDVDMEDHELKALNKQTMFCLQLFYDDSVETEGLVLRRDQKYVENGKIDGGTYERLGVFSKVPLALFDGVQQTEIVLI